MFVFATQKGKIESQEKQIKELHRKVYPERYKLSSGAKLLSIKIYPNTDSVAFETQVGNEKSRQYEPQMDRRILQRHHDGELTDEELINALFEPWEHVNEPQAKLLNAAFELACGGPVQTHVGTSSGGSQSDLRWDGKTTKRSL